MELGIHSRWLADSADPHCSRWEGSRLQGVLVAAAVEGMDQHKD